MFEVTGKGGRDFWADGAINTRSHKGMRKAIAAILVLFIDAYSLELGTCFIWVPCRSDTNFMSAFVCEIKKAFRRLEF